MTRVLALAGREVRAYFLTPGGYIIIALFLLICGAFFFWGVFSEGQVASMQSVLGIGAWLLSFIGPAVTMRLLSEEYRLGTFEMISTTPLNELEIIVGKYLGAMSFILIMLVPTLVYVLAMELYGQPDYGELFCGYLGLLLAATAYCASGVFASTLTNSQAVAFLLALFFWLALLLGAKLLPPNLDARWASLVIAIDPDLRLRDFSIGLIDSANIVYFLSIAIGFLAASVKMIEYRRVR